MGRIFFFAALAFAAWFVFGAPHMGQPEQASPVTLAQLAADPGTWDGRDIVVTAKVIDRASVLGLGGVLIGDGEGNELLAAGWTGPAAPGSDVTVRGVYHLALAFGDVQFPVVLIPQVPSQGG